MSFESTRPDFSSPEPYREQKQTDLSNPYASTQNPEDSFISTEDHEIGAASVGKTILVWSLVCTLSAAPSFFFAIGAIARGQALAMALGVITFIGLYTYADLTTRSRPFRKNPRMRTILRATFIVRSIMVILFPLALTTDLFLGLASVSLVQSVARLFADIEPYSKNQMGFGMTLITTLVQGSLLSGLLFLLGLLISTIMYVARFLMNRT